MCGPLRRHARGRLRFGQGEQMSVTAGMEPCRVRADAATPVPAFRPRQSLGDGVSARRFCRRSGKWGCAPPSKIPRVPPRRSPPVAFAGAAPRDATAETPPPKLHRTTAPDRAASRNHATPGAPMRSLAPVVLRMCSPAAAPQSAFDSYENVQHDTEFRSTPEQFWNTFARRVVRS